MSKIRLLPDHVSNQIAAGEVVERPASVAKELVENAIDARATRIVIDVESGGRRLLKVSDDGEGMVRDDALLAFERHATSKIREAEDLNSIATLGFRGEALASIASVARVELISRTEDAAAATRVLIEGGRMREVKDAAHPRGTTLSVRDLFFNVPARRKFLRSEATETFHLTNLVTHYALAHPEIAFTLTNSGREVLRVASAKDLRERAYQIFGAEFLDNLLEVSGGNKHLALVSGYVSAPRDRRTSRDAQYLFVNGRFVRDQLIGRALSEGYRSILPHGVYPAALLFIDTPLEEVDVNVHPAKTEVRFRRVAAVADAVREAVRSALASAGYVRADIAEPSAASHDQIESDDSVAAMSAGASDYSVASTPTSLAASVASVGEYRASVEPARQSRIEFVAPPIQDEEFLAADRSAPELEALNSDTVRGLDTTGRQALSAERVPVGAPDVIDLSSSTESAKVRAASAAEGLARSASLPPLASADKFAREVTVEELSSNIRPLGQLDESFIIATDDEGLLLIDQHVAHERILFDKYRALESSRPAESQSLLIPETFDLTPAQAAAFDFVAPQLESYGFELMRLSGRTVAIKATPADLPASEARNMLAEILETVDAEKKGSAREALRDDIAASLACHAAIKVNMPLAPEKMRWLIDRLLQTSSPTTCPHGRPVILRLATRDILKGFQRI
ncbi:MAG: DNA mismatch repair endonuclease MutL [Pyrinomonadaceae bacterium]|nr:DNA mismatch repair endonuclease MutL [Pyrinomonadaceae bacterium]